MATFIGSLVMALVVETLLGGTVPLTFTHTRPMSRLTADLVKKAWTRAPSIREQMDALERTDVVVYVIHRLSQSVDDPPAHIRFVSAAAGTRYLELAINCWRGPDAARIELLGHELHHALEIADAPHVRDNRTLMALYLRIGYQGSGWRFETRAAQAMGDRIRRELAGRVR